MYRLVLINMPFASLERPSLALTQLRFLIDRQFEGRVSTELLYLNQELASYLGFEGYETVAESPAASAAGAGEWFFRQIAFPDLPDNSYEYFRRYFSAQNEEFEALKFSLLEKRRGLARYLRRVIDKYQLDKADLVAFTSMFAQNVPTFSLARLLKERNPRITTVMGGANCETLMGQQIAKNIPAVDFVFSGPALVSFPRFVEYRLAGEEEACHQIPGVYSADNVSGRRPLPQLVGEELPMDVDIPLDYSEFFSAYEANFPIRKKEPCILFETSRGCWWGERAHCTFCGLNGTTMSYRAMPEEKAVAQFNDLFARYGDTCDTFESVDNILPRSYLTDVLPRITPPPNAKIFYEVKADLKEHEMQVLAAAGVTRIQPGIESLSSSTLKLMKKGTTSFQNLRFLRNCARYGIVPLWNILVGFPLEEDEGIFKKYLADIPRLAHLPPPTGVLTVAFQRYSPYFVRAQEYGLDLRPAEYFNYIYPFGEEVLRDLVYFFYDANLTAPYAVATANWLDALRAAVRRWQDRWYAADGGLKPELCFTADGAVYDTRSGEGVYHRLEPLEAELLRSLEAPKKPGRLVEAGRASDGEVEQAVGRLEELGLLFREGEQLMSLASSEHAVHAVAA